MLALYPKEQHELILYKYTQHETLRIHLAFLKSASFSILRRSVNVQCVYPPSISRLGMKTAGIIPSLSSSLQQ